MELLKMKNKIKRVKKMSCKHCGSFETVRKSARKVRYGKRKIYSRKNCFNQINLKGYDNLILSIDNKILTL